MKNQSKPIFISCFLIFVLLCSHSISVTAQEVEDEREFDYSEDGEKGPAHWGDLKKEWSACKIGTMQSPVDMKIGRVKVIFKSENLKTNYKPCNATLRNRGHDISLKWLDYKAGTLRVSGADYVLDHAHWHSPSEHTINGCRYDLELHMVHTSIDPNATNKITVIGLLYKIGAPDPFLSKLINTITSMADKLEERDVGIINPNDINLGGRKYFRYKGSLTTPPCTEGVIWTIIREIDTVSVGQIRALRNAVHDYAEMNARPLQPINDRQIELYFPNPTTN
ncbi:alpha carbonic anhydrase 7-like [Mangifera indica]|uniref:alpha carbonic anhydrase 7-like n=1 Tax=Mangifera indica TaxID=29780 RepID=UPI001CF93CAA|nr:alpha carbonic anhydrase 7-like [Mangifera indica]